MITKWDGHPEALSWTHYDVTTMPYRLRNGDAAVIGVGGGRDVLSAIYAGNRSVTGIEINSGLVSALTGRYRDFARVATHPGVTLVHDEARSYLTRAPGRFDVLQMSLIDTWAATGAGAFTLTENGLYTREGWAIFLRALKPNGIFSVSRWFDPEQTSETTRLLSLGVAALLDAGVTSPRDHLVLVTRGRVATLMTSRSPFTEADAPIVGANASQLGYVVQASPWQEPSDERFQRIVEARSHDALAAAAVDPYFDFTAPSDKRPFFFNMLKPRGFFLQERSAAGVVSGNLRATRTLIALAVVAAILVVAIIGSPLVLAGLPPVAGRTFRAAFLYFALIGFGFMLIQIPLLQRFSVYWDTRRTRSRSSSS